MFALVLPLVRRPGWLLGAAVALYAATRWLGLQPPSWTGTGWFFNPFAWQLLFAIGIVLARVEPGWLARHPPWSRTLAVLAVLALLGAAAVLNLAWHGPQFGLNPPEWLGGWLAGVDKTGLHPARLASVLVMAWLIGHLIPAGARWLSHPAASGFVLMGQQGLAVFCAGIFLSFLGRLALEFAHGPAVQVAVNLLGLAALLAVAVVTAWYGGGSGRARPAASLSPTAQAARPCP
jgi:hypothetical protein